IVVHHHRQPGVHWLRRVQHRYHSCGIGLRVLHEGHPYPVKYKGKWFRTAEALIQALRFENEEIPEEIRGKATLMGAIFAVKKHKGKMVVKPGNDQDVANMEMVLRLKLAGGDAGAKLIGANDHNQNP